MGEFEWYVNYLSIQLFQFGYISKEQVGRAGVGGGRVNQMGRDLGKLFGMGIDT